MMRFCFIATLLTMVTLCYSETIAAPPTSGRIEGKIISRSDKSTIEYATVALYSQINDSLITGTVTNNQGQFRLEGIGWGTYYLKISFMGFANKRISDILISKKDPIKKLNTIELQSSNQNISEVEIVGIRKSIDYKIDKKVISVANQITSSSLSAIEVLENIPSINVDIEGNVSLRGSTGFTVLIDGRPSILDPSDALRQIPASIIENIEVITNPSAKYQPDGTAGIINIITKKNKTEGIQGLINVNSGNYNQYGGNFLLSKRKKKINVFIGANYRNNERHGTHNTERHTTNNDSTTFTSTQGESKRVYTGYGFRTGIDWDITPNNLFSISFRAGDRDRDNITNSLFEQSTSYLPDTNTSNSEEKRGRGGQFYAINSNYKHTFRDIKGHELLAQFNFSKSEGDEYHINELMNGAGSISEGIYNTEKGPSDRKELKIDYTLPINDNSTFESGFQGRWRLSGDDTKQYLYENGQYIIQPQYTVETDYQRNIYALYATYNTTIKKLGLQIGTRAEYNDRTVESMSSTTINKINRWDVFPTVHCSYNFSENTQMMVSYTRRIDRPRGYYFEPFLTWMDAYNVRQGNPNIRPEYIDSYEMGLLKTIGESKLSFETYYKTTHDKIERVQSVYSDDVLLHSVKNVGQDYSFGTEVMFNSPLKKWWEIDIMGNLYHYKVEGELLEEDFSNETVNWSTRINNTIRFNSKMQLQLSGKYNSPTATSQGERKGNYVIDSAFRIDFMKRKMSCVIQARDLLQSANYKGSSSGNNFESSYEFNRSSPRFSVTLSYRINNYKPDRKSDRNSEGENGGSDFE